MKKKLMTGAFADRLSMSASKPIPGDLFELVQQAVERTMHQEAARIAASGNAEGLASLGRSIAVEEGRLLESLVIALSRRNPDVVVLSGMKLPISEAALAVIERNDQRQVSSLSLDPEGRSKRTYYPDLVLANKATSEAIVVDVKRSVSGYLGGSKLSELQTRMQAAGLVLPEILWRHHNRLAVSHVSIAIIDGSRDDHDVSEGIWGLSRLDELIGVAEAGTMAQSAIDLFRRGICELWTDAIREFVGRDEASVHAAAAETQVSEIASAAEVKPKRGRGRPRKPEQPRTVTVGLFRPAARPIH